MTATETIIIESRFCGPPDSANGGYICGLLAECLGADTAEVTLWRPPPLNRPLYLEILGDSARLLERPLDEQPVAGIQTAELDVNSPPSPGIEAAGEASRRFDGFERHPFPGCFVCGPERAPADGLRIFAGPVGGQPMVAAAWRADQALADTAGRVRRRFVWAALDCPGAFAAVSLGGARWPLLLGRLCARINGDVTTGEPTVVAAWLIRSEGRKHVCGTALYDEQGRELAAARAVWIQPRDSTR